MIRYLLGAAGAAACLCSLPASGQRASEVDALAATDPASVKAPSIAFSPTEDDRGSYWKYFFFHKQGVPFRVAVLDLWECYSYATGPLIEVPWDSIGTPKFIAARTEDRPGRKKPLSTSSHGYLAQFILRSSARKSTMANRRKCMEYKGYVRYGLSRELWNALNGSDLDASILMQAKIASGPTPVAERQLP